MQEVTVQRIKVLGEIESLRARIATLTEWAEKAPGFKRKQQMELSNALTDADSKLGAAWARLGGTMKPPGYCEPIAA